jgi:tetratricopeptide (TPR) repeat protein
MLPVWLQVLETRSDGGFANHASVDARHAQSPGADEETRALALVVAGLASRNEGKVADARLSLEEALRLSAGREPTWRPTAQKALKELSDPSAYYLPEAERLRAAGDLSSARALLSRAAEAFSPGGAATAESGRLLAQRAILGLEGARDEGGTSAGVAAAARDAEAAIAAGALVEGNYARGRIAEARGELTAAVQSYRQALAAAKPDDSARNACRIALARALIRRQVETPTPAEQDPVPKDGGKKDRQPGDAASGQGVRAPADATTLVSVTVALEPEGETASAEGPADLQEAVRLADEAIKAGDNEGYLVKAQAMAKQGLWTEAVMEYMTGLEHLCRPPGHVEGLRYLLENHPAFRVPDVLKSPNPFLADRHYAAGLRSYAAANYGQAEKQFSDAVRYAGQSMQDARFLYFLGLSQLMQGRNKDAFENFRRASVLEQQNKPASAAVSATLERIQGEPRTVLSRFRP